MAHEWTAEQRRKLSKSQKLAWANKRNKTHVAIPAETQQEFLPLTTVADTARQSILFLINNPKLERVVMTEAPHTIISYYGDDRKTILCIIKEDRCA